MEKNFEELTSAAAVRFLMDKFDAVDIVEVTENVLAFDDHADNARVFVAVSHDFDTFPSNVWTDAAARMAIMLDIMDGGTPDMPRVRFDLFHAAVTDADNGRAVVEYVTNADIHGAE